MGNLSYLSVHEKSRLKIGLTFWIEGYPHNWSTFPSHSRSQKD